MRKYPQRNFQKSFKSGSSSHRYSLHYRVASASGPLIVVWNLHWSASLANIIDHCHIIQIGLIQQIAEGEEDCLKIFCGTISSCKRGKQIENIIMAKFESKGPRQAMHLLYKPLEVV